MIERLDRYKSFNETRINCGTESKPFYGQEGKLFDCTTLERVENPASFTQQPVEFICRLCFFSCRQSGHMMKHFLDEHSKAANKASTEPPCNIFKLIRYPEDLQPQGENGAPTEQKDDKFLCEFCFVERDTDELMEEHLKAKHSEELALTN